MVDEELKQDAVNEAAEPDTAAEKAADSAAEQAAETAGANAADNAAAPGAENAEAKTEAEPETKEEAKAESKDADRGHKKEKDKDKKKSGAEVSRLEAKVAELEKKLADSNEHYVRLAAEYENYRKRTQRELDGRYSDGKADVWKAQLEVLDNLERALAVETSPDDPLRKGIELTYKQLQENMKAAGVTEIEAKGKPFDPELHNAVMHCDDENLGENTVADVFVKGYRLGDKVLRHSMVKVAN